MVNMVKNRLSPVLNFLCRNLLFSSQHPKHPILLAAAGVGKEDNFASDNTSGALLTANNNIRLGNEGCGAALAISMPSSPSSENKQKAIL